MNKRIIKRLICFVLTASFVFTQLMIIIPTAYATSDVEYSPRRQKFAIAPKALYVDENFYSQYVKTDALWAFNSIYYFTDNDLNYNTGKSNYTKSFYKEFSSWDTVMDSLRKKGQLWINLRTSLTSGQQAEIQYFRDYYHPLASSGYRTYGNMDYVQYKGASLTLNFANYINGTGMKYNSLVFADLVGPNISWVYATASNDINASRSYTFNKDNDYLYIHIKYDEYIRFADNRPSHGDVYLKLKVAQIGGDQVTSADERAGLISLRDDTLTFRYEIPSSISGVETNHYIYGFGGIYDSSDKNVLDAGQNAYDLRVLTHTGELTGHWNPDGLYSYKSKSLITDLAGNPSDSTSVADPAESIYFDTKGPVVEKVSLTAVGNKSQYMGKGSKIIPKVTFSEPIYSFVGGGIYNEYLNPQWIYAHLNIKDTNGNYIKVLGKYFEGDAKDTLIFNSTAITDGMMLEDGADRIKIKCLSYVLESDFRQPAYDKCGNLLNIVNMPVPENQFILDTQNPEITTNMPENGGIYIPQLYDSQGGNEYDSFNFSFNMSDGLSGLLPKGAETLEGSFKWSLKNGVSPSTKNFDYAVSTSADKPSEYNSGSFGESYTFPQASNLYLHIRYTGLEGIDLNETTLSMTANDLVGNSSTDTFVLNGSDIMSLIDRTAPEINADKLYTFKDGDEWNFAADFNIQDYSMVDTSKVKYQWTEKDNDPVDSQWLVINGLGANAQTVSASVYYQLDSPGLNEYDLYIKASDCSNNENTQQSGPYYFTKNLEAPVFGFETPGCLTEKAVLKITAPAQTVTEQVYGQSVDVPAVVLVKLEDDNGYSVKTITADQDISIDNVFASSNGWAENGDRLNDLVNNTYYGESNVRIISGYGISYDNGSVSNPYGSSLSEQDCKLYTAPEQDKIHNIRITSSVENLADGWNSPDDGPKYYTDLTGAAFNISVENSIVNGWGSKDIDFTNSYFGLYKENDDLVYKTPLSMSTQVSIPADLNIKTGQYYAKAVVSAKTSGKAETEIIENICVDTAELDDFGLAKIQTEMAFSNPEIDQLIDINTIYYGYDAAENSLDNTSDKLYGSAPYLFLGSAEDDMTQSVKHKIYFTTLSENDEMFVKLWNASQGLDVQASKEAAVWLPLKDTSDSAFEVIVADSTEDLLGLYAHSKIPVINNSENILYYQICHANGKTSGERTMFMNVSDEQPEFEVELTPESEPSQQVTAVVTKLLSATTPDMKAKYWNGNINDAPIDIDDKIDILQTDNNWFYTVNSYGNYKFLNKSAENLDMQGPVISTAQSAGEGDEFAIEISVSDKNNFDLLLKYDDTYMSRLGIEGYFPLEIPEADETWTASEVRKDGIYKIERTDSSDGGVTLTVYGVYLYDQSAGSQASLGYSIYAKDIVGNYTETGSNTITVKNVEPSVSLDVETITEPVNYIYVYDENNILENTQNLPLQSVTGEFNQPVTNVVPSQHHNATTGFVFKKPFLSIFKDGVYTVTYEDIFGNSYSVEKQVDGIQNDMNITLSGTKLETGKYNISIEPDINEDVRFSVFADCYEGSLFRTDYSRAITAASVNSLEFDKDENTIIMMMEYRSSSSAWYIDELLPVIIIDGSTRQAPDVKVNWHYHEFASHTIPAGETQTDNNVDVWITADRTITGINGKLTTHTFTYGESASYIFEYQDGDGNIGIKKVEMPIEIVQEKESNNNQDNYIHDNSTGVSEEDLIITDTEAPQFYIDVYGKFGTVTQFMDVWDAAGGTGIEQIVSSSASWASGYIFKFNILDKSKTRIILLNGENPPTDGITYENGINEVIEGVICSGSSIAVNKAAAFTAVIIDEKNNMTVVSFPADIWGKIDSILPEINTVEYVPVDFSSVNALFTVKDDKSLPDEITLVSPAGLSKDTNGRYILTFNENKSVEVTMRDLAGNIGTGTITVDSIDNEVPVATVAWWSPCLKEGDYYDITQPTASKTNKTITAKVEFNKPIKYFYKTVYYNTVLEASESEKDNHEIFSNSEEYLTYSYDTDSVTLNFLQNATVKLEYTGVNNAAGSIWLTIEDVIDKTLPTLTMDITDETTDTTGTVVFDNFSEPVYVSGYGETANKLYDTDDTISKAFTSQGTYTFKFTDEAGNITIKEVEIKNIDEYSPAILLSDMPNDGQYYKDSFSFKATMSEAGILTYEGISKTVNAPIDTNGNGEIDDDECNWVTFKASQNGSYKITAADLAGRKTNSFVNFNCFDKKAPTVIFNPITLTVLDSTDFASFEAMLKDGVILADDLTDKENIVLTYQPITPTQLSTSGLYEVVYTALDSVGNETNAIRYVKVFSAAELNVKANNVRTEANGITLIDGTTVDLDVSNLPLGDGEPYNIYLRKGIWTAGEMKNIAKLDNNQSFTLSDKGYYYTLYIVTQNRGTYLTYLYAQ